MISPNENEKISLEDFYHQELKTKTMRQALKTTWQKAKIPGKITLQEAGVDSQGILWNRISVSMKMKAGAFELGPNPGLKDLTDSQKVLIEDLREYFSTGPFTTIRHNLRGIHLFWQDSKVYLIMQLLKSTQNTHTNLKVMEKWIKFRHPEIEGAYTMTYDSNLLFRFSKDKLTGKMPFRALIGKETIQTSFGPEKLIVHLQSDFADSVEAQTKANAKFDEWIRPNTMENLVFWNSRSPMWIQMALAKSANIQLITHHYPTVANIMILGKKIKTTLRTNTKDQTNNDLLDYIKKNDVHGLVIEDDEKIFSRKWFESMGDSSCRKILRVYNDWNILTEECRILHKYGWTLLKSTAIQTQANSKHFKIMVLFTTGKVTALPQKKKLVKVAPATSGIKFVQK